MTDPQRGKVAEHFMEVMKGTPLILALVVMNFALIGLVYLQATQFNTQRKDNIALFVQVQGEVQKLLSQCIVPPPTQR
jgi:hypothetical protein